MRNLYLVRHGKPQYPDEHSYYVNPLFGNLLYNGV